MVQESLPKFPLIFRRLVGVLYSGDFVNVIAVIFIVCATLSVVIPPFQSPDEHDHIKRAYLLTKGVLLLDRLEGSSSGGYIDSGLMKFMESYGVVRGKLSAEKVSAARSIKWSRKPVYSPAPGTAYYFPVIYLPHALGLWVGEQLNLSVNHSYRLARAFALIAVALILMTAFRLYPPNPLVLALIALPMTLFQISSASLDGVSLALAIFSISAFLRFGADKKQSSAWVLNSLAVSIAVLASSRIHTLPMLALLAATFMYKKDKRTLIAFLTTTSFVIGWTFVTLITTIDLRVEIGKSTSHIIAFYIKNPLEFFFVISRTVSDHNIQKFYYESFLGILGWLDTPFGTLHYTFLWRSLLLITALSVSFRNIRHEWPQRALLLAVSVISVLFIFFALLVTWTAHPAQLVSGIQGRYFLIPSIIFAYAIGGNRGLFDGIQRLIATSSALCLFIFSVLATVNLLIVRYYLT